MHLATTKLMVSNAFCIGDKIYNIFPSLYNKTNEMHFRKFYSDNIHYILQRDKVFIFRRQFYRTCSLWYVWYVQ